MSELPPKITKAITRFEDAVGSYWEKDSDPNISTARLDKLNVTVQDRRRELEAAITETVNLHDELVAALKIAMRSITDPRNDLLGHEAISVIGKLFAKLDLAE